MLGGKEAVVALKRTQQRIIAWPMSAGGKDSLEVDKWNLPSPS